MAHQSSIALAHALRHQRDHLATRFSSEMKEQIMTSMTLSRAERMADVASNYWTVICTL
jgi:hypothetical protein